MEEAERLARGLCGDSLEGQRQAREARWAEEESAARLARLADETREALADLHVRIDRLERAFYFCKPMNPHNKYPVFEPPSIHLTAEQVEQMREAALAYLEKLPAER